MSNRLEKDVIVKRINGIQRELSALHRIQEIPFKEFAGGDGFKLAQFHLHRALEGVFNISTHILSRLPGAQATSYAEVARKLGEFGIIDKKFSEENLVKMAKYRNRLVHFYAEITEKEMYDILNNNLGDFDTFLSAVKKVLETPQQFRLSLD